MKKISFILLSIALLYAVVHPPRSSAQGNVSVELFYNALAPQGDWIEAGEYGYVWQPREIEADWRPYSNGHWVHTNLGWTWVADERESWGWATYHYGRWTRLSEVGWVWVPGTEWAPAWVSFRHSDRHVGWAPLPPEARFVRTVGFQPWVDSYYDIGPTSYTFVETRSFGSPTLRTVIVPVAQNIEIINTTRNITVINYRENNIYVGGPEYDVISRVSEQPIRKLTIDRRSDVNYSSTNISAGQFASKIEGDRLQIAAPTISASTSATIAPTKVARKVESVKVDRGWEKAGDSAKVEELRKKMKSEAKAPAGLPPQPKFDRKASLETSTDGTPKMDATPKVKEPKADASPKMDATPKVKEPKADASPKMDGTPKVKEPKVKEPKVKSTPAETSPEMTPRVKAPKGDDMATPASSPKETKRPKATPDEAAATPGSKKSKKDPATNGDMGTPAPSDASTPKVKKQKADPSAEATPTKPMKETQAVEGGATTSGEVPKREKKVKEKTETPSVPASATPSTDGATEKRPKMDSEPKAEKVKASDGSGTTEDKPKEKKTKGEVASPTPSR